tara:strand:- start:859 stop:1236 length:378 start_codon:yes stop_codon:yes gene_type:complete
MPKGKGTYGSKVGRPSKKVKGYQKGGIVDMKNPMMPDDMQGFAAGGVVNAMDRSQNIQGYADGGKVKETMSHKKTIAHFQGTPQEVAKRMSRNSAFKKGMEKYYNMTLNEKNELVPRSTKKNKKK